MKLKRRMLVSVACLALLMMSLAGCGSSEKTATPTPTPVPRTISGRISYEGNIQPTHQIIVVAGRQGEQNPAYSAVIRQPGLYTISNVTDATYTIFAFMDVGDDMGPPQPNEPAGYYDADGDGKGDVVVLKDGKPLTGIDITLRDPM